MYSCQSPNEREQGVLRAQLATGYSWAFCIRRIANGAMANPNPDPNPNPLPLRHLSCVHNLLQATAGLSVFGEMQTAQWQTLTLTLTLNLTHLRCVICIAPFALRRIQIALQLPWTVDTARRANER